MKARQKVHWQQHPRATYTVCHRNPTKVKTASVLALVTCQRCLKKQRKTITHAVSRRERSTPR